MIMTLMANPLRNLNAKTRNQEQCLSASPICTVIPGHAWGCAGLCCMYLTHLNLQAHPHRIHTPTHIYAYTNAHSHTNTHTHSHISHMCIYIYVCVYRYICIYIYVYVRACTCTCTGTCYMHTHTYRYTVFCIPMYLHSPSASLESLPVVLRSTALVPVGRARLLLRLFLLLSFCGFRAGIGV